MSRQRGRAANAKLPMRVCILCGLSKALDRFPKISKRECSRDKACALCVNRIDAPTTEKEKVECRARSSERHAKTLQRRGILVYYRQRNAPIPIWLAEEHGVDPECTWDPSRPTLGDEKDGSNRFTGMPGSARGEPAPWD